MTRAGGGKKGNIRNILFFFLGGSVGVVLLVWLGLKVQSKSFTPFPEQTLSSKTVSIPVGLPAPVNRFYTTIYGEEIPVIKSIIIFGRRVLKPFMNIPIPARFVFVHDAGKDYRHYFEATIFGIPVFKVNEGYIDGVSFFESPMASITNDSNSNQGSNLTLWAEAIWFPAIWVTDPRFHWETVDENSAFLYVPFENDKENFLVCFNPEPGLIDTMETMRYRDTGDDQPKILWILRNEIKQSGSQGKFHSVGSAMWLDQGSPWNSFEAEEIILNVDVSKNIRQRGY